MERHASRCVARPRWMAHRADRLGQIRRRGNLWRDQRAHRRPADLPWQERRMTVRQPATSAPWPRRAARRVRTVITAVCVVTVVAVITSNVVRATGGSALELPPSAGGVPQIGTY